MTMNEFMKQVLTKQDVVKALAELSAKGKKATLAMLHAAVGNRGSMSTLVRIKGENRGRSATGGRFRRGPSRLQGNLGSRGRTRAEATGVGGRRMPGVAQGTLR